MEIFCNITNVFTVTFDQFHASLMNESIHFFNKKNLSDFKLLNGSASLFPQKYWAAQLFSALIKLEMFLDSSILEWFLKIMWHWRLE